MSRISGRLRGRSRSMVVEDDIWVFVVIKVNSVNNIEVDMI